MIQNIGMTLLDRKAAAQNKAAQNLYQLMTEKKSNLALSLDVPQKHKFLEILERTAEHIVILKTHIDIIQDFDAKFINQILVLKEKHKFLIFEDRKFADIGNTVKLQYTRGVYKIIEWADIVNAHIFPGPGVIEGLREAWEESKLEDRGLILLPQMTGRGNLFDENVMAAGLKWAQEYCDFVIGFIGAAILKPTEDDANDNTEEKEGESENQEIIIQEATLSQLRKYSWPEFVILTPGVKIAESGDHLGQTYVTPEMALDQGGDIIIVGRGIYEDMEPGQAARMYRQAGWNAFAKKTS